METTQIYTQASIRKLQEIHAATHPNAALQNAKLAKQFLQSLFWQSCAPSWDELPSRRSAGGQVSSGRSQ
jgi:hypothetical protein